MREKQLAEREIDVMQRELSVALQQIKGLGPRQSRPTPQKRKGKFRHKALKKEAGHIISMPSGILYWQLVPILMLFKFLGNHR